MNRNRQLTHDPEIKFKDGRKQSYDYIDVGQPGGWIQVVDEKNFSWMTKYINPDMVEEVYEFADKKETKEDYING